MELGKVADKYGVQAVEYQNQGQPNQWVAGMNAAQTSGADIVNIACGTDPAVLNPQIAQLKSDGIPVVAAHNYDPTKPKNELAPNLAGIVNAQYKTVGELQADWVILQTKGRANVLAIDDIGSDIATPELVAGIKQEFEKYCPDTCKVRHVSVPIPNWSTAISPLVAAEVSSNPDLNYVIPVYDDMVKYVIAPLTSAAATDRVKIATFNASPSVIKMIQEGDVVTFDVGEDAPRSRSRHLRSGRTGPCRAVTQQAVVRRPAHLRQDERRRSWLAPEVHAGLRRRSVERAMRSCGLGAQDSSRAVPGRPVSELRAACERPSNSRAAEHGFAVPTLKVTGQLVPGYTHRSTLARKAKVTMSAEAPDTATGGNGGSTRAPEAGLRPKAQSPRTR